MATIPKKMLKWREKKGPGKIMRPSTFSKIKRSASARGFSNPEAVAGKAYWTTLRAKYRRGSTKSLSRARGRRR